MNAKTNAPHHACEFKNIVSTTGLMSLEVLRELVRLRENTLDLVRTSDTVKQFNKMKLHYIRQSDSLCRVGDACAAKGYKHVIDGFDTSSYSQMLSDKKRLDVNKLDGISEAICDLASIEYEINEDLSANWLKVSGNKRRFSIKMEISFNSLSNDHERYNELFSYKALGMTDEEVSCLRRACIISALDAYISLISGSLNRNNESRIDLRVLSN